MMSYYSFVFKKKNMKSKLNILKFFNYIFFVSTFMLLSYTDAMYVSRGIKGGVVVNLKYITLFLGLLVCMIQRMLESKSGKCNNKCRYYYKEFKNIFIVIYLMIFISLIYSLFSSNIPNVMFEEFFKLLLPIVYAYYVLNTLEFEKIYSAMVLILFLSIGGYILEIGIDTFTISNLRQISYANSYSPFESHYSAGISIVMCAFFMYYRNNWLYSILSFLFVLLTFKRLALIFAILLLILPKLINLNKIVSRKWSTLIKVIIIISTVIYYNLLSPRLGDVFQVIFKDNAELVTMGRSIYINKIINGGFISSGFGSTFMFIGKSIEMDLIKILLELSIIGLILFVWYFWDITRNHLYCIIYMSFVFINLLTSHSLTNVFSWILTYIIMGCISYKKEKIEVYS